MNPWTRIASPWVALLEDDIDTDQIIPARFLVTTTRQGLGASLFADRGAQDTLARGKDAGARILVAGANFGCGSSREHAPWALLSWGFRAVVARSFGDIFRANALECGLLPLTLSQRAHEELESRPGDDDRITIDLHGQTVELPSGHSEVIRIEPFARARLLAGRDTLDHLLAQIPQIEDWERSHA